MSIARICLQLQTEVLLQRPAINQLSTSQRFSHPFCRSKVIRVRFQRGRQQRAALELDKDSLRLHLMQRQSESSQTPVVQIHAVTGCLREMLDLAASLCHG